MEFGSDQPGGLANALSTERAADPRPAKTIEVLGEFQTGWPQLRRPPAAVEPSGLGRATASRVVAGAGLTLGTVESGKREPGRKLEFRADAAHGGSHRLPDPGSGPAGAGRVSPHGFHPRASFTLPLVQTGNPSADHAA